MFSDVDSDGFTDWTEVEVTGTDPTNVSSFLGRTQGSAEAKQFADQSARCVTSTRWKPNWVFTGPCTTPTGALNTT